MNMAATGLRLPLRQQGSVEFALVGGAGTLTLRTDDGDRILHAVSGLETEVSQGRLGIEVSRTGTGLLPYLRVGARSDAGDGVTGTGMEAVTGVRYGSGWLDFEAQARWLGAHSKHGHAGYEEFGGMARLNGEGPRGRLRPATDRWRRRGARPAWPVRSAATDCWAAQARARCP